VTLQRKYSKALTFQNFWQRLVNDIRSWLLKLAPPDDRRYKF